MDTGEACISAAALFAAGRNRLQRGGGALTAFKHCLSAASSPSVEYIRSEHTRGGAPSIFTPRLRRRTQSPAAESAHHKMLISLEIYVAGKASLQISGFYMELDEALWWCAQAARDFRVSASAQAVTVESNMDSRNHQQEKRLF